MVEVSDPREWDSAIPSSLDDVVTLLLRRIEVHEDWVKWIAASGSNRLSAQRSGIGSVESHTVYINQYRAAIALLERPHGA